MMGMCPVPGGYVRHLTTQWLGIIRPDKRGHWADWDGNLNIHWMPRFERRPAREFRPADGWYSRDFLAVIS